MGLADLLNLDNLNKHMTDKSYVEGVAASQKDVSVFKALCPAPGPAHPHAARWYAHIQSLGPAKAAALPGSYENLLGASSAKPAAAPAPAAAPKAEKKGKPSPEEIERLKAEKAAEKAAKGAKGGDKKGGDKKEEKPKEAKKEEKKEEKAPDAAADAKAKAKLMAKIIKEGGKKGVEIEGASDMGGLDFFCTTMELPEGDLEQLELSMLAMNAEPDPEAEDRKGCSGHIGKMIYSAGVAQLALVAYVPDDEFNKSASKVDVTAWMDHVLGVIGGEVTKKATPTQSLIPDKKTGDILTGTKGKIKGKVIVAVAKADADKGKFPLKDKDAAMAAAFSYLRSKGAFPEDNDDDSDEMIFGDDDNLDDYA
jgi:hypothetical protein